MWRFFSAAWNASAD